MPEMPDVTVYAERLARRVVGKRLHRIKVLNPFLVRTAVPPLAAAEGKRVEGVERLAKRIVLALEGELFLVIHLMIAGRLKWLAPGSKPPGGSRWRCSSSRLPAPCCSPKPARSGARRSICCRVATRSRRWTRAGST
jgi:formamidopyrimidine-DNA glycosylase